MSVLQHRWSLRKRQFLRDGFAPEGVAPHYPPDLRIEPQHLTLRLQVDIDESTLQGAVTTRVLGRSAGATKLTLHAVDFENVEVKSEDGQALTWRYTGEELHLRWENPFTKDEERSFTVTYTIQNPISGLYFSTPDEAYPERAYYAATDHETERARYWLPCVDQPNVRTTLEFFLRGRADLTLLANGALQGEEVHDDNTRTAHWVLKQRCPSYLVNFAIGEFTKADDGEYEGIPVATFANKHQSAEDLQRSFGRTKEMLAWMSEKLGLAFPYPKYYQWALPGIFGAMENISLVSWDDKFVLDETLSKEWGWLVDQINVHEMAHSYFGDTIVCRDYAQAWLKESWATYIETCWLEHKFGQDEALYNFYRDGQMYFSEADNEYKRPLMTREFESSWQMYDMHLYPGGACRLHTLRNLLGDDIFWTGVRDYVNTYTERVVETEDFRRIMEKHSGRSLVQFFDQWIHKAGYPDIKVEFEYDEDANTGTFTVEQKQIGGDSKEPVFVLQTRLSWVIEGETFSRDIELTRGTHDFTVPMSAEPSMVRFDPDAQILHKLEFNPGPKMLREQLTSASDVIGRILAGQELAKTQKPANLRAVSEAYANESFWGVRQQWVKALGKSKNPAALEGLKQIVASEEHHLVLETVFRSLFGWRDRGLQQAVEERIAKNDLAYRALGAAYQFLGQQRHNAPLELLMNAALTPEFSGFAQGGALLGLAETRRPEAWVWLQEHTAYGKLPDNARHYALKALADLGLHRPENEREPAVETLVDHLTDPVEQAKLWATNSLVHLRASSAQGALLSLRGRLAHQDQVSLDAKLKALRSSTNPKVAELEKQVESLLKEQRKLLERLDKLEDKKSDKP
jgi:aminopeptidase N